MNLYRSRILRHFIWKYVLKNPQLRSLIQRIIYPNRDEFAQLLGARILINTQKELGYYRALGAQQSNIVFRDEVPKILVAASLLRNNTTFVDCGANIGLWALGMARLTPVHQGLRVLAFEAHPDTFQRLERGAANYPNVTCYNVALSSERGVIDMTEGAASGAFGVDTGFTIPGRTRRVETRPLDDYLAEAEDIVMKIDVEGLEFEVLVGASRAIAAGKVRAILIDGIARHRRAEALRFLQSGGFDLLHLDTLEPVSTEIDRALAVRR